MGSSFAAKIVAWQKKHGRHDLPWQGTRDPYAVWLSEVMLQQTQVATVIPYYERFRERFPDIHALAAAPLDDVLRLWSGLGYYARARNLHRAAQRLVEQHAGEFPHTLEEAMRLPGVGRSTAGAILSLAHGQRHPILDGNARRVLARYFGVAGDPGSPEVQRVLWQHADECTPAERTAAYTQAIMDLGATVCVRQRPLCAACPLAAGCVAMREHRQHELPGTRARRARRLQRTFMVLALRDGDVLLERRPPSGIWGGLWGLPEFESVEAARTWCAEKFGTDSTSLQALDTLRHTFTHFDLDIEPLRLELRVNETGTGMEARTWAWYNPTTPAEVGIAAPVRRLIEQATHPLRENHGPHR